MCLGTQLRQPSRGVEDEHLRPLGNLSLLVPNCEIPQSTLVGSRSYTCTEPEHHALDVLVGRVIRKCQPVYLTGRFRSGPSAQERGIHPKLAIARGRKPFLTRSVEPAASTLERAPNVGIRSRVKITSCVLSNHHDQCRACNPSREETRS